MLFTNFSFFPIATALFVLGSAVLMLTYARKKRVVKQALSPTACEALMKKMIPFMRPFKVCLLIAGLGALLFALLDPRSRSLSTDIRFEGIDLVLVYDVSRSMDVKDTEPSRLEAAKAAGEKMADSLAGNRTGLVAFAADAYRLLPLTTDLDAVKLFIQDLSTGLIGSQSTDVGKALETAAAVFSEETLTHKAVILFTDGENLDGDPGAALDTLKKKGVRLFVVGTGTEEGGPVPIYENGAEAGKIRDILGQEVISKKNQSFLDLLARTAEGSVHTLDQTDAVIERINGLQKTALGTKAQSFLEPKFRIFGVISMICLLLFLFLPEARLALPLLLLVSMPLHGLTDARKGYESYNNKEYPGALRYYRKDLVKNPAHVKSKFGETAALYKLERSEQAENGFLALTNLSKSEQALSALFNAGNAQVQGGKLDQALSSYGEILKKMPASSPLYKKAMNNYLYVLQQKQQNQQNQQNQKPNQQGQNSNQNQQNQNPKEQPQNQNQQNMKPEEQKDKTQSRPISPKEVENLLGVAQSEEKQNLKRQSGKNARGVFLQDKY